MMMYLIEHEGKRIVRDPLDCNPASFRSAIRFIRQVEVDAEKLRDRELRRTGRYVAEKARRGTPIRYRIGAIRKGISYPFWK